MSEDDHNTIVLGDRFELPGYYAGANIFIKSSVTLAERPNHSPGAKSAIRRVFISSTIDDLTEYRQAVRTALQRMQGETFLFEEDTSMAVHANNIEFWQTSLKSAQGYVGLCGYWYGMIAPNSEASLPHMAFRWAINRWQGQAAPPLIFYTPEIDSPADKELRKRAQQLIPSTEADLKVHTERLKNFHSEIYKTIGVPNQFADQHQLHDQMLVTYAYWRGATPFAATQGNAGVVEHTGMPLAEREHLLGCLGRGMHLSMSDAAVSQAVTRADIPAVALLITGDRLAGHKEFLKALLRRATFRRGRQPKIGRPNLDQYDIEALVQWTATVLGHPAGASVVTPQQLAEWIHVQLQNQQLCFVLDQAHRLVGGVTTFHTRFWQPLYQRLRELRGNNPLTHRLIAILVNYGSNTLAIPARNVELIAPSADYGKLQLLPELAEICTADVIAWLRDDLSLSDIPSDRLSEIAARALQDEAGDPEGAPKLVFSRLQQENIWKEEVDGV